MALPKAVHIVEVGPRDGLQAETKELSTSEKIEFIKLLGQTGLRTIEVTSFVSPKWVPQLADAHDVYSQVIKRQYIRYPVLVPNMIGLEKALAAGVNCVAVFISASEGFAKANTNCTIAESMQRAVAICERAKKDKISVRAYISCTLGCPYDGEIHPSASAHLAKDLLAMGCYEISLGDTIGVGTPMRAKRLVEAVAKSVPVSQIAAHFHNTYGQALANIYAVLQEGVATFDSSVGGLGGCPYAKGSAGNVATEDLLYLLTGLGIETGVDMDKILIASKFVLNALGLKTRSAVGQALVG